MNNQPSTQNMASASDYPQYQIPNMPSDKSHNAIDSLANTFGRFSVSSSGYTTSYSNPSTGPLYPSIDNGMGPKTSNMTLHQLPDGTFVYSPQQYNYQQYVPNQQFTGPYAPHYPPSHFANVPPMANISGPNTPRAWMSAQSLQALPDLTHRRTSYSSNEDASPRTPGFGAWQQPHGMSGHSPNVWSTPSPTTGVPSTTYAYIKNENGLPVVKDMWEWTQAPPAIPEPVPARHSGPDGGRGSLAKILDNVDGTTNIYVRGLQPDTTDELLYGYGERFGRIESQKAIIDHANGTCKGYSMILSSGDLDVAKLVFRFGFIRYTNFIEAENAIRGFFYRGYEAKFARVRSFPMFRMPHD